MGGLVIGSVAASWALDSGLFREPKDFDVLTRDIEKCREINLGSGRKIEPFWHPALEPWVPDHRFEMADLDFLYTLKISHLQWDLRNNTWEKHINDAMLFKRTGAKLDWELYLVLIEIWKEVHGPKRVDLTQDKDAFFSDAVRRVYDHDSLHYSVAYGARPLYEEVMVDGAGVTTDMAKVKALAFEDQVRLYREEIYATALERWVIPSNYRCSPRRAYADALKKTIVSLTKGWSSRFLIENYDTFRKPDMDYVRHHKSKSHHLIKLEGN